MILFSVFYPYSEGCWFDSKYYAEKHVRCYADDPLVKGILIESGNYTRDFKNPPRYAAAAHFFYDSIEDLERSRSPERTARQKQDNVNFTNIPPRNLISEIAYLDLETIRQRGDSTWLK